MTRLHDLYRTGGQSPWIDDLMRSYVDAGGLEHLVEEGIRGVTSNPTIMAKAIEAGSDYDEQFYDLIASGASIDAVYRDLVLCDGRRRRPDPRIGPRGGFRRGRLRLGGGRAGPRPRHRGNARHGA